jgi:hypothetical protein
VADKHLPVWVGIDAAIKRDSAAIVATTWDYPSKKVRLVYHRVFQPTPEQPLDLEETLEATALELNERFNLKEVRYDPYQFHRSATTLAKAGVPMVEFPQSTPNLTAASQNLYELIKGGNLLVYPDEAMRLSVQRAVALETTRGWRITKEKSSHKIDVVVALAQAALGAVEGAKKPAPVDPKLAAILRGASVYESGDWSEQQTNQIFGGRPRIRLY